MKVPHLTTGAARTALVSIAASLCGAAALNAQLVAFNAGDLLVGFHATGGTGASQTFVFNLGYSVDYRDNSNIGFVANIGPLLTDVYGADWFSRSDLFWGVAGVRDGRNPQPSFGNPPPVVDGDPSATVYITKAATGIGASTPWSGYTRASLTSAAGSIRGTTDIGTEVSGTFIFQTAVAGTDLRGALVAASAENSWASKNPQPGSAAFGIFTGGIEGSLGTGEAVAYLDLYRILASTNGADPSGTVGTGAWVTTFTIDNAGNVSAIPEPKAAAAVAGLLAILIHVGLRARRRIRHN